MFGVKAVWLLQTRSREVLTTLGDGRLWEKLAGQGLSGRLTRVATTSQVRQDGAPCRLREIASQQLGFARHSVIPMLRP